MINKVGVVGKSVLFFLSFFLISATVEKDNIFEYSGKAVTPSGKLIYKEYQKELYNGGRIQSKYTEYKDHSNTLIARRSLDFRKSIYCPDMKLEDFRSGKHSMVTVNNGKVKMVFKKDRHSQEKSKEMRLPDNFITDDGIHYFILKHWRYLSEGNKVNFYFPVPKMLDIYKFQLTVESTTIPNKFIVRMDPTDFILKSICNSFFFNNGRGCLVYS